MKNTFTKKTVTIHDLQTRLPMILAWLEAGEEVVVKPKALKRAAPSTVPTRGPTAVYLDRSGTSVPAPAELKNRSVVFQRPLAPQPVLTQADFDEVDDDLHSTYGMDVGP